MKTHIINANGKLIFAFLLFLFSCGEKERPNLFIKTTEVKTSGGNQIKKTTISKVSEEYWEVTLASYDEGYYKATRDILKAKSLENFNVKFFFVTDSLGSEIKFQNPSEFLNFAAARGYEMADQEKGRFNTDYTFRRKK